MRKRETRAGHWFFFPGPWMRACLGGGRGPVAVPQGGGAWCVMAFDARRRVC